VHVSQLRKTLAQNGHEMVATRWPGYAIELDPEGLEEQARQPRVATGCFLWGHDELDCLACCPPGR
jgi:hypothetical protein